MKKLARKMTAIGGFLLFTFIVGELGARFLVGIEPLSSGELLWEAHETRGWAHRPGSRDRFVKLGTTQEITINSRGLREREIAYQRNGDVFRILVLGDSVVAGFEVKEEDRFTRVVERLLKKQGKAVEVINAGHRGYGTDQSLLFLQEEGYKYAPDLVLYCWNTNDMDNNATVHRPYRRFGKSYFTLNRQGELVLEGVPVPVFETTEDVQISSDGQLVVKQVPTGVRMRMWVRDNLVVNSSFVTAIVHLVSAVPQLSKGLKKLGSYRGGGQSGIAADTSGVGSYRFRVASSLVSEMG